MQNSTRLRCNPSTTQIVVRPNDLDSLGHVNNAIALEYLESGRWDWLASNSIRRTGKITPVVSRVELDYLREIFPGTISITTQLTSDLEELTYRALFEQRIYIRDERAQQVVAIEARVVIAFLDRANGRLCSLENFFELNGTASDCSFAAAGP